MLLKHSSKALVCSVKAQMTTSGKKKKQKNLECFFHCTCYSLWLLICVNFCLASSFVIVFFFHLIVLFLISLLHMYKSHIDCYYFNFKQLFKITFYWIRDFKVHMLYNFHSFIQMISYNPIITLFFLLPLYCFSLLLSPHW